MTERFIEIEGKTFERCTKQNKTVFVEVTGTVASNKQAVEVLDETMNMRYFMKVALAAEGDWNPETFGDKWKAWRQANKDATKFDLAEYKTWLSDKAKAMV